MAKKINDTLELKPGMLTNKGTVLEVFDLFNFQTDDCLYYDTRKHRVVIKSTDKTLRNKPLTK